MSTPSPIRELIDRVRRDMPDNKLAMDLCDMVEGLKPRCPFEDEGFSLLVEEPCPVCGMTGDIDAENKCVG